MMIKGESYIVFLMKVHALSGLSKVEEKQQFQIIVKKALQDLKSWNERIVAQEEDSQREKKKNQ